MSLVRKTVIVADDQPGIRRLLSAALSKEKYDLLDACSGEDTIAIIKERQVDLVFLDVRMPRLDGIATLRQIVQMQEPPPVIVMTGQGNPDLSRLVKSLGAAAYLEKPFDIKLILTLVEQYTEKGDD